MLGAAAAAWVTRAQWGGKAGLAVLLVLLVANGIAGELGRRRQHE